MKLATLALAAALLPACAQEFKIPLNVDALEQKAEESAVITMDKPMLRLAGRFLSDRDADQARARKLIAGLDSIYVRNFKFAAEGAYNMADIAAVRRQLHAPEWGRLVGVRSRHGENVDVYFKNAASGQLGGILVLDAEPRELTIVSIIGTIDPEQLADLGGEFGVPRLDTGHTRRDAQ